MAQTERSQTRLGRTCSGRLVVSAAPPAGAWNQLIPYDGNWNTVGSCLGVPGDPCLHWPKVSSPPSWVGQVYLAIDLKYEEVNLKPVVRDTISEYNGIAALNPYLQEIDTATGADIYVETDNFSDPYVFGSTSFEYNGDTGRITWAHIRFNTMILWKTTLNGYCYDIPVWPNVQCTQDARKVSNHEMGHAQGLAYEKDITAVMVQGFVSWYHVKNDDKNGIIHIYGAYNP